MAFVLAFAASSEVRADEQFGPSSLVSQMLICDGPAKVPILFSSAFVAIRGITDGSSRSWLHDTREENLYLVTVGTASFAHVACGPVIHAANGNYGHAALSLGLRGGLPAAAFAITYGVFAATKNPGDTFGKDDTSILVGSFSVGAAILAGFALDYTLLGFPEDARRRTAREREQERASPQKSAWQPQLMPLVAPSPSGVTIGVAGAL